MLPRHLLSTQGVRDPNGRFRTENSSHPRFELHALASTPRRFSGNGPGCYTHRGLAIAVFIYGVSYAGAVAGFSVCDRIERRRPRAKRVRRSPAASRPGRRRWRQACSQAQGHSRAYTLSLNHTGGATSQRPKSTRRSEARRGRNSPRPICLTTPRSCGASGPSPSQSTPPIEVSRAQRSNTARSWAYGIRVRLRHSRSGDAFSVRS